MWFTLLESQVAGVHYHVEIEKLRTFVEGAPLTLHREPDNSHDVHAVALHLAGRKIGYVPRTYSQMIAALMDHGYDLSCTIDEVVPKKGIIDFKMLMLCEEGPVEFEPEEGDFPMSGDEALGQDKG